MTKMQDRLKENLTKERVLQFLKYLWNAFLDLLYPPQK